MASGIRTARLGPNSSGLFTRTAFGTPVPGNPFGANGCLNTSVEAGAASGQRTCNFSPQIPQSRLDPKWQMSFINSYPMPNYNDPFEYLPTGDLGANTKSAKTILAAVRAAVRTRSTCHSNLTTG